MALPGTLLFVNPSAVVKLGSVGQWNGQGATTFVRVQHDMCCEAAHIGVVQQTPIAEAFVGRKIRDDDDQHVVDWTRNAVALLYFPMGIHLVTKGLCGTRGFIDQVDMNDRCDAQAQLAAIKLRSVGQDHALITHALYAPLNGRCRQADLIAYELARHASVSLIEVENPSVKCINDHGVEFLPQPPAGRCGLTSNWTCKLRPCA